MGLTELLRTGLPSEDFREGKKAGRTLEESHSLEGGKVGMLRDLGNKNSFFSLDGCRAVEHGRAGRIDRGIRKTSSE